MPVDTPANENFPVLYMDGYGVQITPPRTGIVYVDKVLGKVSVSIVNTALNALAFLGFTEVIANTFPSNTGLERITAFRRGTTDANGGANGIAAQIPMQCQAAGATTLYGTCAELRYGTSNATANSFVGNLQILIQNAAQLEAACNFSISGIDTFSACELTFNQGGTQTVKRLKMGANGTGPGGTGRALFVDA